jgi:ubiquinone/menaquinone biosynthesis C-methylase UbiE
MGKPRDFFDGRAEDYYRRNYETPRTRHQFNLAQRRDVCLSLVPPTATRILDMGCGPGAMTIPLVEQGRRVTAIDLSSAMARDTYERIEQRGGKPSVAIADACALPFASGVFDVVVTTGVLEYVKDAIVALREIHRVLAPCGTLIATMSLPRRLERFTGRMIEKMRGTSTTPQYIYSVDGFDALVDAAQFQIDESRFCSFSPFPLDVVWPASVRWIDERMGSHLQRSALARRSAKTYVLKATAR